jgi:hypothetical protein
MAVVAAAVAALTLAGCGGHDRDKARADPSARALFSPNGEPLNGGALGRPKCDEALARWFDRVDANRHGTLTLDEFLADARRQFAAMDLDRDGLLNPAELARYRATYTGAPPAADTADTRRDGRGSADIIVGGPDPVMAADVTLRNQVSLAEFLAHAERIFAGLDANRDGRLAKAEVLRLCHPADEGK